MNERWEEYKKNKEAEKATQTSQETSEDKTAESPLPLVPDLEKLPPIPSYNKSFGNNDDDAKLEKTFPEDVPFASNTNANESRPSSDYNSSFMDRDKGGYSDSTNKYDRKRYSSGYSSSYRTPSRSRYR